MSRSTLNAAVVALALVATGSVTTAGQASAATVFGSKVDSLTATAACNLCSVVGLKDSTGSSVFGSPVAGILTNVRLRYNGPALSGLLRIQHPTGVVDEFRNDGETAISTAADSTAGGRVQSFPTRMKIAAGDHLGVAVSGLATFLRTDADALCASRVSTVSQPVGTSLTFNEISCSDEDLLAEGTVEADVDGDGFGDETQDLCPTNAAIQAACPSAPAVTPPTTIPTRKCKKKKHEAAAKAKKCKKKRKK